MLLVGSVLSFQPPARLWTQLFFLVGLPFGAAMVAIVPTWTGFYFVSPVTWCLPQALSNGYLMTMCVVSLLALQLARCKESPFTDDTFLPWAVP